MAPEPNGNGDSSRVTTFQLYQQMMQMDRDSEARHNALTGDLRALTQTVHKEVLPDIADNTADIKGLKARFATSLTMLGGAIGAVVYLYFNSGGGGVG